MADTPQLTTTVPMQSEAELPAGEYEFRFAQHGRFSETARAAVNANRSSRPRYVDRRNSRDGIWKHSSVAMDMSGWQHLMPMNSRSLARQKPKS